VGRNDIKVNIGLVVVKNDTIFLVRFIVSVLD
jgi:hypothetical protein